MIGKKVEIDPPFILSTGEEKKFVTVVDAFNTGTENSRVYKVMASSCNGQEFKTIYHKQVKGIVTDKYIHQSNMKERIDKIMVNVKTNK